MGIQNVEKNVDEMVGRGDIAELELYLALIKEMRYKSLKIAHDAGTVVNYIEMKLDKFSKEKGE